MDTPVSFPIAKLLKEKGFNLKVINFYDYERLSTPFDKQRQVDGLINYNPINWNSSKVHYTSAPTIAEVVMWLYEKHGIWIEASLNQFSKPKDLHWMYSITFTQNCTYSHSPKSYKSPIEAYEAGIEDVLINMI